MKNLHNKFQVIFSKNNYCQKYILSHNLISIVCKYCCYVFYASCVKIGKIFVINIYENFPLVPQSGKFFFSFLFMVCCCDWDFIDLFYWKCSFDEAILPGVIGCLGAWLVMKNQWIFHVFRVDFPSAQWNPNFPFPSQNSMNKFHHSLDPEALKTHAKKMNNSKSRFFL